MARKTTKKTREASTGIHEASLTKGELRKLKLSGNPSAARSRTELSASGSNSASRSVRPWHVTRTPS